MAFTERSADGSALTEPVYLFVAGDVEIEAPVQLVWPLLLAYPSWQNYTLVEHVSGPQDEVGEVVRLEKEEVGITRPPYFARTLKIDPGKRIVWKTFSDDPTGKGGFGIVSFSIEPKGAGTRFIYDTLYESFVTYSGDVAERDAFEALQYEEIGKVFQSIFAKLKGLAEERASLAT